MKVAEIIEVKELLNSLQATGIIADWELPYENLLTRRSAAIFFLTPADPAALHQVWDQLSRYDQFSYRLNDEKKLSAMPFRITFSAEEKEKNEVVLP